MAPYYVEFPADPVVNVHWKKKNGDGPPDPPDEDDCFGGTWSFTADINGSRLEIHDALTMKDNGIPGDRFFSSPPDLSFFRVVGSNVVEFGPIVAKIGEPYPPPFEKNLYGRRLNRPGSRLLIEGETIPSGPGGPPPYPPSPFWPSGWIPKFTAGAPSTLTLAFSGSEFIEVMPAYPDHSFMDRTGSWSYTYGLYAPGEPPGGYPCFDPDLAPAQGVFYMTSEGGGSPAFTPPYKEWWEWAYNYSGQDWPGWYGDQFYSNMGGTGGSVRLKFTQICGPQPGR